MSGGPSERGPGAPDARGPARPDDAESTTRLKRDGGHVALGSGGFDDPSRPRSSDSLPTMASGSASFLDGHAPRFAVDDRIAERYRVVRFLAEGGMGEVYEVEDLELRESVALKTIRPAATRGDELVERFKREIQLARQVTHPNVCRLFEFGTHRGDGKPPVLFLTMELLGGETLAQRLDRQGKLTLAEAAPIAAQIAAALATAHEAGIVHRDFKSSNVMLVPAKSGERAVVTDFGLARSMGPGSQAMTISGEVLGTPAYMAPEQLSGGTIGPPTDIYALGIVLYEMVTGKLPFWGETPFAVALQRLHSLPTAPRKVNPDVDPRWDAVILRCLEREPSDRYASAEDVARALLGEKATAASPRVRRKVMRTAMAVASVVVLGVAAYVALQRWSAAAADSGAATVAGAGATATDRKSVAVLGFANLSQKPESAWLSTAFAEMLRTDLAAGGMLRTVPGENVSRMKVELALADTASLAQDTLVKVRRILDSDYVVLGSYVTTGPSQLVLSYSLQDASTGEVVDADSIPGAQEDLFAVVARAGDKVRSRLGVASAAKEEAERVRSILPSDPEAARLYAEGLAKLRAYDAVGARDLLTQAVSAAPDHALVHAAHGEAWAALGYDTTARNELRRASELAAPLPKEERLAIEARQFELEGRFEQALLDRQALVVLNPDDLDHGLRLAATQIAFRPALAERTLATLRRLPAPASQDPRIPLTEAAAAKATTNFAAMEKAAASAAERAQEQGARLLYARARAAQCDAEVNLGRFDEATPLCEEAKAIFAEAKDGGSVARIENVLGVAQAIQGEAAAARAAFERSLASFRAAGDRRGMASQLDNLGNADADQGNFASAETRYQEALGHSRAIGDRGGEARSLNNLGSLRWEARPRRAREALAFYEQALKIYRDVAAPVNVARTLYNVAEARQELGELDTAASEWSEAARMAREARATPDLALILLGLGGCELTRGNAEAAVRAGEEARGLFRQLEEAGLERQAGELQAAGLERLGRAADAAKVRGSLPAAAGAAERSR